MGDVQMDVQMQTHQPSVHNPNHLRSHTLGHCTPGLFTPGSDPRQLVTVPMPPEPVEIFQTSKS